MPCPVRSTGRVQLISLSQAVSPQVDKPLKSVTHGHCDARPTNLPSRRASPPVDRYQIILLGDIGTRVRTTCPRLLPESARPGVEPATFEVASPTL